MERLGSKARLEDDVATLRALIDSLLDEGRPAEDLLLVSTSRVLRSRVDELRRQAPKAAGSAR